MTKVIWTTPWACLFRDYSNRQPKKPAKDPVIVVSLEQTKQPAYVICANHLASLLPLSILILQQHGQDELDTLLFDDLRACELNIETEAADCLDTFLDTVE